MGPKLRPFVGIANRGGRFPTTQWSMVMEAGHGTSHAFAELYTAYCYPLYAFSRRSGDDPERAQDLINGFFTRSFEKADLTPHSPQQGRFRTWILAAFKNYRAKQFAAHRAAKREGSRQMLSLDELDPEGRYSSDGESSLDAEAMYVRSWGRQILTHALAVLAEEHRRAGKERMFNAVSAAVLGGEIDRPYAEVAAELGLSVGALKVKVNRLRHQFGEILRAEVARTVLSPEEVDLEMREVLTSQI